MKKIVKAGVNILKETLEELGEENIDKVKAKMLEAENANMKGMEKAKFVANYVEELAPGLKSSAINLLIENLLAELGL